MSRRSKPPAGRVTFREDGPVKGSSWVIRLNGETVEALTKLLRSMAVRTRRAD